METPQTGWTDARCNEVMLFIEDYNGCYDNMWWYMVLYMITASVASSLAVAAYYTEQKINLIGTNARRYVLTIIKVQCNILIHHRSCGNAFTVPVPIKTFVGFCQHTYTSKPFEIMFNAQILNISNTWYPFFTKKKS